MCSTELLVYSSAGVGKLISRFLYSTTRLVYSTARLSKLLSRLMYRTAGLGKLIYNGDLI